MAISRESQMVAWCDNCGDTDVESWIYRPDFVKKLRKEGWSIGKKVLCPKCRGGK